MLQIFKQQIKKHLGNCSVIDCEKPIWKEELTCSISVGNNRYYVCLDHSKEHFNKSISNKVEINNYIRMPSN